MRLLFIVPWLLLAAPAAAQTCPEFPWSRFTNPGPQDYTLRETVPGGNDTEIVGFSFSELKGEFAKAHIFIEFRGECVIRAVSLGSYAYLGALAEKGEPRPYHLDLYTEDTHATLDFFDRALSYEEVRARALEALK